MGLWSKVKSDEIEEVRIEIKCLRAAKSKAIEELETLKLKKRLEQEEIAHLQKITSEKKDMEVDRFKIKLEREHNEQLNQFKKEQTAALLVLTKELHGKLEGRFNVELGNLKEIYKALMERLPNVNLTLTKKLR